MTIEEMTKYIKKMGLKLRYKPVYDFEAGVISLISRKSAHIVDGLLVGSLAVCTADGVQVWTPKRRLAKDIASTIKCPIRMFDTEAEITIPYSQGDTYLRKLGIRVRKAPLPPTPGQLKNRFKKGEKHI